MQAIRVFDEIDRLIFKPRTKVTVYTSYMINITDGFMYHQGIQVDIFGSDLLKVYPITIWWEGDRSTAYKNGMDLHLESDMNLQYLIFQTTNFKNKQVVVLNEHHVVIKKSSSYFTANKAYMYGGYSQSCTTHIKGSIYLDERDALFDTAAMFNYKCSDFFNQVKRFGKVVMTNPKYLNVSKKAWGKMEMAHGQFSTGLSKEDILRFRKLLIKSHKVYQQSFKEFHDEYRKVARRKSFSDLPVDELKKIVDLANVDVFVRYLKLIYTYHFSSKVKTVEKRNEYFKGYLHKVLSNEI